MFNRYTLGLAGFAAVAVFAASSHAALIEGSASYVGSLNFGNVNPGLNDGNTAAIAGYSNPAASFARNNMFGYALNGQSTLTSVTLHYGGDAGRRKYESVNVYTDGGVVTYSGLTGLASSETIALTGVNTSATSFVYVEGVTSLPTAGDTNKDIAELQVDGAAITPWTNHLAGVTGSTNGAGWNFGTAANMVNGITSGQTDGIYNSQVAAGGTYAADTYLEYDMGSAVTSRTFAIAFHSDDNRHGINEFRLIFDDDGTFTTPVTTTSTFSADELEVYQTFDLGGPITAQYVRFELVSLHNTAGAGESNTGLTEIQLFEENIVIPEPASLALLGLGSLLISGRQRRKA